MNKWKWKDCVWTLRQGIGALAGAYIALWLFLTPREANRLVEDFTVDVALAWAVFGIFCIYSFSTPVE